MSYIFFVKKKNDFLFYQTTKAKVENWKKMAILFESTCLLLLVLVSGKEKYNVQIAVCLLTNLGLKCI